MLAYDYPLAGYCTAWLGKFVSQDLLAPVALDASQFVPEAIDAFTYEGTLYGMPYAMENVGLFRNTDLVPEAPTTWEELSQVSSNLVASGTISYGLSLPIPDPYHTHPLQTAYGGYIFGRDADGDYDPSDLGLDNSGSIAAYTWLDQEVEAGRIPHTISWDDSHLLFEEGHAAFLITGPWSLARIRNSGVNYAISPFPAGDAGVGAPFTGVQGIMLNAHAEDLATARAFLLRLFADSFCRLTNSGTGGWDAD